MTEAEKIAKKILDNPLAAECFSPMMLRILDILVRAPGIDFEALTSRIYCGPSGGPEWGSASVRACVTHMRPRLAPYGITVGSPLGRGNSRWRIRMAEKTPDLLKK